MKMQAAQGAAAKKEGANETFAPSQRAPSLKKKKKWTLSSVTSLLLAIIPLVGFVLFNGFTLVVSFLVMFCDVDLYDLGSGFDWNNFAGFKAVFVDGWANRQFALDISKYFYRACGITVWVASTQFVTLAIALAISVLLATKPFGGRAFQILFFIPYICSSVAVSIMWKWIFSSDEAGVLNTILGKTVLWTSDPKTMTWTIVVAIIWQAPGYGIVMYKAALANIDREQYEAAALDGAVGFRKFWYITVPGIAPTTFYLLLAGVNSGLLTYDIAALMIPSGWGSDVGGSENMGLTLMRLVYYLIGDDVSQLNASVLSSASVISWVLFAVTATIAVILFRRRQKSMEG